jgi:hypothetical protein
MNIPVAGIIWRAVVAAALVGHNSEARLAVATPALPAERRQNL